jgi:serine/threonine protein kinase
MKVIEIENQNMDRIRAFKQEQKIYKSITGGFNVKLYYSFSLSNLYFLILDYGCGGSLRQLLENEVYFE